MEITGLDYVKGKCAVTIWTIAWQFSLFNKGDKEKINYKIAPS